MNVIDLFIKLLSAESITPNDGDLLEFIKHYLNNYEASYFNSHGVKNLFLTKKFGEGEHLCFAGHVDVVPAGDGWESNPFIPLIKDSRIYARGAQDMKSGVAAFVTAMKETKEFHGRLSLLLTSDEEGDAHYGTQIVLKELKERNLLPQYAVVAEPTCDAMFGDSIKIGRRGSNNGIIRVYGKQGHAAYPAKSVNAVNLIAPILPKIAGKDLDNGDDFFEPSQFVITDIRGGLEVTNVTPGMVKIMFNVRNSTATTPEDIKAFVAENFKGLEYEFDFNPSAKPFMTNPTSKIVQNIQKSIKKITKIETELSTAGGTSDARFFGEYGVETVEFGVVNDTIHAPNENTAICEVEDLYLIFKDLIKEFK